MARAIVAGYLAAITVTGGVLGPFVMAWQLGRQSKASKILEYARQDEVADRLQKRQDEIAAHADEVAATLKSQVSAQSEAVLQVKSAAVETAERLQKRQDEIAAHANEVAAA